MGCIQLGATFLTENCIYPAFIAFNSFKEKAAGFCERATDVVVVKLLFFIKCFTSRESNDRQTFDWMNSIKLVQIQSWSLCQTLDVSNYKPMRQCLRCDFADRKI